VLIVVGRVVVGLIGFGLVVVSASAASVSSSTSVASSVTGSSLRLPTWTSASGGDRGGRGRGLRRPSCRRGGRGGGAWRDRLAADQLDDRHRRVVALARADLGDPGVAAVPLGELRGDLGEQLCAPRPCP
jgi:hypothetical protein